MRIQTIFTAMLAMGLCAFAQAQSPTFSGSALSPGTVADPVPSGGCGTATLSQNPNNTPTAGNSVACSQAGIHRDNSYFRAFDLATFPQGFTSCAVEFGIEQAAAGGADQPVTVRVYSSTGAPFPGGTRTEVGTTTVNVANQTLSLFSVPLTATVPAGAQLVAEVFTPDGVPAGNSFFIGSNTTAETGPSYLQAADCGLTAPTPTAAIGFPNMHIILNVRGTDAGPPPMPMLTVTPATGANFGDVQPGQTANSTVTISNTGNAPVTITSLTPPTAPFSVVNDGCTGQTLAAMTGTCTVTYRFSPTTTGQSSQTITVISNAPPVTFVLQGNGAAPPIAVPGPGPLALITLGLALLGFGAWRATRS